MTGGSTTPALTHGVALLERAMGYTLGNLLLITPDAISNPTPCSEWDLHALLLHMNDSLLALHEAIAVGHVGIDGMPESDWLHMGSQADPAGEDGYPIGDDDLVANPIATLRSLACQMIGAWANAGPSGEIGIADRALTSGVVAATGAVEVAVHGWDLTRACGRDRPIPPALAEELLELCVFFVGDADRPSRFAAAVDVSPLANPSDRLVAFLGRRPY